MKLNQISQIPSHLYKTSMVKKRLAVFGSERKWLQKGVPCGLAMMAI